MFPEESSGVTAQTLVTLVGDILSFNFGLMFGCTASQAEMYETEATPLNRPISRAAGKWIYGYFFLGTAMGALIAGPAAIKAGPKTMLLIAGIFQLFRWGTEHFAYDIQHIYFSRIFGGISGGITYVVLPIFIRDISQEFTYATLMATIDFSRTLGIIVGYCVAEFMHYSLIALLGFVVSMLFQLFFPFVQESPYYFMYKHQGGKLEKALCYYRGVPDFRVRQYTQYTQELAEFYTKMKNYREHFYATPRGYVLRACIYFMMLLLGAQVNGSFLILTFVPRILGERHDSDLDVDTHFLIMAIAQCLGSVTTLFTFRRMARRMLLALTSFISGIVLGSLAMYLAFHINLNDIEWISIGLISIHLCSTHMGLYPLALLFPSELFPGFLRLILSSVLWALTWFALFLFSVLREAIPSDRTLSLTLFVSAGFSFSLTVFGVFVLPETFERSVDELQAEMGYVTRAAAFMQSYYDAEKIAHEAVYL